MPPTHIIGEASRIADLSEVDYHAKMKAITIKLPEETLHRLKQEARASGRTVAAVVRERLDAHTSPKAASVYDLTAELAGCVAMGREPASNARRKFRRS